MWAKLVNSRFIDFYLEFHEIRLSYQEDWMPMVRAVKYLQSQEYASRLNAFTSHANFCITTASSHDQTEGHAFVGISWDYEKRTFKVDITEGNWLSGPAKADAIICDEAGLHGVVDALILRLFLSRDQRRA